MCYNSGKNYDSREKRSRKKNKNVTKDTATTQLCYGDGGTMCRIDMRLAFWSSPSTGMRSLIRMDMFENVWTLALKWLFCTCQG